MELTLNFKESRSLHLNKINYIKIINLKWIFKVKFF